MPGVLPLGTAPVPLTTLAGWAPLLQSNCGFCDHWIAKKGSVKEHIKRMRKHLWDACLNTLQECCESRALHSYLRALRPENSFQLFQVAAATAWVSAGAPEQPGALNVRCKDFTADRAQLLMGDNTMNASNSERAALRFLERRGQLENDLNVLCGNCG